MKWNQIRKLLVHFVHLESHIKQFEEFGQYPSEQFATQVDESATNKNEVTHVKQTVFEEQVSQLLMH